MSSTSRTGLVPTPKRNLRLVKKRKEPEARLPAKFESSPVRLSLRPFGGLFNPFAPGCSVLCNHPAPTAVRDVIHQLKSSLNAEAKNAQHAKEKLEAAQLHGADHIPEDLCRRYTDADSRPLTPSPSATSARTRTSAGSFLHNRRCVTPELGKNELIQRKKIILDLRRSHSQETLYWKPSSDLSQGAGAGAPAAADVDQKPRSAGALEERKARRQRSEEQRPRSSLAMADAPEPGAEDAPKPPQTCCINEHDLGHGEEDVRRGKKRKKLKPAPATTTFHLSEDPETQVATLGPDSMNPSTRPSLIPNCASLLPGQEKRASEPLLLKGSYLTDEAFQALKTELDVDVIENTFGRYLNRALREAIKYLPPRPKAVPRLAEDLEKLSFGAPEKMPRKFSKSATRFEVPLSMKFLEEMTVLEYLSKYVWVSRQRKQLYKRVFLKYLTQPQPPEPVEEPPAKDKDTEEAPVQRAEYVERTMALRHLPKALEDVLEFHGNERNIGEVLRLLDYGRLDSAELPFRAWCGVVSFAERLALDDPTNTDSCDELEKADFNSMEQRLDSVQAPGNLREVFRIIRRAHNV